MPTEDRRSLRDTDEMLTLYKAVQDSLAGMGLVIPVRPGAAAYSQFIGLLADVLDLAEETPPPTPKAVPACLTGWRRIQGEKAWTRTHGGYTLFVRYRSNPNHWVWEFRNADGHCVERGIARACEDAVKAVLRVALSISPSGALTERFDGWQKTERARDEWTLTADGWVLTVRRRPRQYGKNEWCWEVRDGDGERHRVGAAFSFDGARHEAADALDKIKTIPFGWRSANEMGTTWCRHDGAGYLEVKAQPNTKWSWSVKAGTELVDEGIEAPTLLAAVDHAEQAFRVHHKLTP